MRNWLHPLKRSTADSQSTEENGVLVGQSVGEVTRTSVYLPADALNHHSLVIGNAGTGKTTLLAHLAVAAMEQGSSVVVLDADGDLVPILMGRVPKARVGEVYWMDWGETPRKAGLNWLDLNMGLDEETIVSNLSRVGPLIWKEDWSPCIEEALTMAMRTLLIANRALVLLDQPQFTCLNLVHLFEWDDFRHRLLEAYVNERYIRLWWERHFDGLPQRKRLDQVDPLLVRLRPFTTNSRLRTMMGQSESTVPLQALPREGAILLVNQHSPLATTGECREALSVLLLNYALAAVQQSRAVDEGTQRKRVVIVLNGKCGLPDRETAERLAELERAGVSFIMSTQGIGQRDNRTVGPLSALLSNVRNLFVFRTTGAEAQFLQLEIDGGSGGRSISHLPNHLCYLRTHSELEPPWSLPMETLPPQKGDPSVADEILTRAASYTRSAGDVCDECVSLAERWSEHELTRLRPANRDENSEDAGKPSHHPDEGKSRPMVLNP